MIYDQRKSGGSSGHQLVMEIDPTAFMIIGKVNEVHGNGFTLPKKHAVKTEK